MRAYRQRVVKWQALCWNPIRKIIISFFLFASRLSCAFFLASLLPAVNDCLMSYTDKESFEQYKEARERELLRKGTEEREIATT